MRLLKTPWLLLLVHFMFSDPQEPELECGM